MEGFQILQKVSTHFPLVFHFRWKYGDVGKITLEDGAVCNCATEVTLRGG